MKKLITKANEYFYFYFDFSRFYFGGYYFGANES